MKFGTKYWDGYSQQGEAQLRALDLLDLPSSKGSNGAVTARRNGDFTSVEGAPGAPTLCGFFGTTAGGVNLALVDLQGRASNPQVKFTTLYKLGPLSAGVSLARLPYLGDGYVGALLSNVNDVGDTASTHWPSLLRMGNAISERKAADAARFGHSVSFIDQIGIGGLGTELHNFAISATGWGGAATRFRFALTATYYTDAANPTTTRAPVCYTGDTATLSMRQVAVPYIAGRDNPSFSPYVIGKGQLQALMVVTEDTAKAQVAPYLITSTDHGATWTSSPADFLTPYLYSHPASGPARAYYDAAQIGGLGTYAMNVYLGAGKSLLIIPNGLVDMNGTNGAPRFAAMAFLGLNGSGYTRIAWPPDTWYVSANGTPFVSTDNNIRIAPTTADLRSGMFAFGQGCMYLQVAKDGFAPFMFTRDFGSTWQFSLPTYPSTENGVRTANGTVLRPYQSAAQPGTILFAAPNFAPVNRVDFLTTDGTFAAFKRTPATLRPKSGQALDDAASAGHATGLMNRYFTTYAGRRYIFPAFPMEFDQ